MAGQTLGTADAALKEVYEDRVVRQLNDETPLSDILTGTSEGVETDPRTGGKFVKFAIHVGRNSGIGARREMEALPTPGNQKYITAQVAMAYLYGDFQVTGQIEEMADGDINSFLNLMNEESTRLATDLAVDFNRQLWGDGTGRLGTVASGSGATATLTKIGDAINFQVGMKCDQMTSAQFTTNINPATGTPSITATGLEVASVDLDLGKVTFTTSPTWTANDVLTRVGNVAREVYGLRAIVNDANGNLFGLDPATQPLWKSNIDRGTPPGTLRPISEGLMTLMTDRAMVNGGRTNVIIMGLGVRRSYVNLLQQMRTVVNTNEVKGGASGMAFVTMDGGIKLKADWTAPPNTMVGLSTKDLTLYHDKNWSWWDKDGSRFQRIYAPNGIGYDAKAAIMYRYCQLGAHKRNTHWMIQDIQEAN